jgi:glutaredoxin
MAKKVTIYSTATCVYCKMLKDYLNKNDIKYEVKMADEDQNLAQELYEKSGQLGVPFTIIEDEDKNETSILGFDRPKVDAALGL